MRKVCVPFSAAAAATLTLELFLWQIRGVPTGEVAFIHVLAGCAGRAGCGRTGDCVHTPRRSCPRGTLRFLAVVAGNRARGERVLRMLGSLKRGLESVLLVVGLSPFVSSSLLLLFSPRCLLTIICSASLGQEESRRRGTGGSNIWRGYGSRLGSSATRA